MTTEAHCSSTKKYRHGRAGRQAARGPITPSCHQRQEDLPSPSNARAGFDRRIEMEMRDLKLHRWFIDWDVAGRFIRMDASLRVLSSCG